MANDSSSRLIKIGGCFAAVVGCLLLVVLLPMSFNYLDFYEV
jgi:hypothetical protein